MKIVFRADAGLAIGTGHVTRCLTLALELARRGHACRFVCRDLPGNLNAQVAAAFPLTVLPAPDGPAPRPPPAHAAWAGVGWARDAAETHEAASGADWLVLDHYALDARWQRAARPAGARLMVIDDLADRPHDADLLLDQTLGRAPSDYDRLLPGSALRLTGAGYALLRPEFGAGRQAALTCRAARGFRLRQLLIAPGGVDADDASGRLLDLLAEMELPEKLNVTVALGPTAPHLDALRARRLPFRCDVRAGERDMAGLMASADLCIGAAGVSLLERCALGLPSLLVVLAENQERPTRQIVARGAAIALGAADDPALDVRLARALARSANPEVLAAMSAAAGGLCDGAGTARVADALIQFGTV